MPDEHPEVRIETPELTVVVSAATTLDQATKTAQDLFDRYRPVDRRLGATGFGQNERRDIPEVQSGTMPVTPRDFPER